MKNRGISLIYALIIFTALSLLSLTYLEYMEYRVKFLKLNIYTNNEEILKQRLIKKEIREINKFNKEIKASNYTYFNCTLSNYKVIETKSTNNNIIYVKYIKEILGIKIYVLEKIKIIKKDDEIKYISLSYKFLENNR